MNILTKLKKLRPTQDTAGAIQEAIGRLSDARAEAEAAEAAALARRRNLLLEGSDAELTAAEADLKAARDDQERLQALGEQLEGKWAEAKARELAAKVETACAASDAAHEAFQAFVVRSLPMLRAFAAEARTLHDANRAASDAATTLQMPAGPHRHMLRDVGQHPRTDVVLHLMAKLEDIFELRAPGRT